MNETGVAGFVATAGEILFCQSTLDNSMRGVYIEALIFSGLRKDERWRYVGLGWGPWDLQRGTHRGNDRVRIQIKVKAFDQLWPRPPNPRYEFDLGWKKKPLDYFDAYYNEPIFGTCEPNGFRCDLFLFAWHGPKPSQLSRVGELPDRYGGDQRNPNEYIYVLRTAGDFTEDSQTRLKLSVSGAFAGAQSFGFCDLPRKLNDEAERVLQCRTIL